MYLSNKQLMLVFAPLGLLFVLIFFQEDLLSFMKSELPSFKNNLARNFTIEADKYLKIKKDIKVYDDIFENVAKRKKASVWISKDFLYKHKETKLLTQTRTSKANKNEPQLRVEAIFPKHNMAIINSKFVQPGSNVDGARVIKINFDKVLLKTNKGLQWLHLFH